MAAAATASGKFKDEIILVKIKERIVFYIMNYDLYVHLEKIVDPKTRDKTPTIFVDEVTRTSSLVSDGAVDVLLKKRSLALKNGIPILGVLRYGMGVAAVFEKGDSLYGGCSKLLVGALKKTWKKIKFNWVDHPTSSFEEKKRWGQGAAPCGVKGKSPMLGPAASPLSQAQFTSPHGGGFYVPGNYVYTPSVFQSQATMLSSTTWHRRVGYPGEDVLRRLESSNLILRNKSKLSALCHTCQLGKHVKLPFYKSESSVKCVFEIIHSDLWTSPIASESGIKYYAIFLDYFSHFVLVYHLHKKSDLFDTFVAFRAYVNNQFNVDIKALQCDHEGEYDNTRFHDLFCQNGIQFRFSCPRTSQQNGKSERMLRTINNLIRTLLFQAHMPPSYWVEALNMAAHLLNILPSTAINNEIPFTKLYNQTPTYEHLSVFGFLCYPPIDVAHKLEPRSAPCIFLGHPTNHRGYRCLDLSSNKIIISRHVRFDEDVFPFETVTSSITPS
ncbi:ribonuclease H-like domain-containing protein [Tanacetum coccineum]